MSSRNLFCKLRMFFGISAMVVFMLMTIAGGISYGVSRPFEGKTITIACLAAGPKGTISGPLYIWRDEWEKISGAKLEIAEIPFSEIYEKIMTDLLTGTGAYDGFVTYLGKSWGDLIGGNFIVPIDQYFDDPRMPKWPWDEVCPAQKKLLTWEGRWYGWPLDCDGHILYYRRDILSNPEYQKKFAAKYGYELSVPPRSWQELRDAAEFFTGWDWNGDGENDYGLVTCLKVGGFGIPYHFPPMAASFSILSGPTDRYHGIYYFDPETMEPLINQPGNVKALQMLIDFLNFGPPDMIALDIASTWDVFIKGRAVFNWSWGDVAVLAEDPERSNIVGKCGCAPLPGSMEVWDRERGKFRHLETPNFVGNVSGGGWDGLISKLSPNPEVVYHFFSFMSSKKITMWNAVRGWTGYDMGAYSFEYLPPHGTASVSDYIEAGWPERAIEDLKEYIEAYWKNYNAKTILNIIRIPGANEYMDSLDIHISEALLKQVSPQQALDRVYQDWQEITDRLGRERQKRLYQISVGYAK